MIMMARLPTAHARYLPSSPRCVHALLGSSALLSADCWSCYRTHEQWVVAEEQGAVGSDAAIARVRRVREK
jgi:hypothetical protein